MLEQSKLLYDLLQRGAYFYVSGYVSALFYAHAFAYLLRCDSSAKRMPNDVRTALRDIVQKEGDVGEDQAEEYLKNMDRTRRYQVETWS